MFKFAKRMVLFVLTNMLVMFTITILLRLTGVDQYFDQNGVNYGSLLGYCFIWGMTGSFISLMLSRIMAKAIMGVKVIDPNSPGQYADLLQMVSTLSRAANLPVVPEVGIYESPEVNAFATGPTQSRALIAFSSGILQRMNKDEIAGVAGHELGHIANGDMVTMALLQGVINAFARFFARALAFALANRGSNNQGGRGSNAVYWLVPIFEIVFSFLGFIVVAWFSRKREFRADRASASYTGKGSMIAALRSLQRAHETPLTAPEGQNSMAAFKISGSGFRSLFSTHPPLEERIRALESA